MRPAEATPRIRPELGALIGMNQRASGPSGTHGHQHGVEHQLSMDGGTSDPAHDLAREEIEDDGEVQPPFATSART